MPDRIIPIPSRQDPPRQGYVLVFDPETGVLYWFEPLKTSFAHRSAILALACVSTRTTQLRAAS